MNRQKQWNEIWNKKYSKYKKHKYLHVSAGYDELSYKQWQRLSHYFIDKIGIKNTDEILEVGCGSGAFLAEIKNCKSISGVDYSEDAIKKIRKTIEGNFKVSEASKVLFSDNLFDVVISFGVFFYFNNLDYAEKAIYEMLRVLKPGGKIFIGEVNNLAKKDLATKLRRESEEQRSKHLVSSDSADHLYYPISFFENFASENNMAIEIIEQDTPELSFYYNSPYRFSVILTAGGL